MRKILIIVAAAVIMTVLIKAAYITRGYFAFGGEWLVWAFPLLIHAAKIKEEVL